MKFYIALFLTICSFKAKAQTYEFLISYTAEEINNIAIGVGLSPALYQAEFGIDAYKINYDMPYLDSVIEVSGAMFIPNDYPEECGLPVHTYMHGTIFKRSDAPSFLPFEAMLGYLMGSPGYIVIMPDYVGLGDSQLMHPYVHAQSEADAGIYMMQAIENLGDDLNFSLTDQVFISGYSQGGHAAMAMAEEIQTNWAGEYEVTACAPMSGPYDISGTQVPIILENEEYSNPAYLAYNVIGWNSYYGNIYDDLSEVFQEPYASLLPDLFDGETGGGEINDALPNTVVDLVQPGIIEDIMNNPDHPFMLAAVDNDVYEWAPEFDIQMYYCTEDEQVFYENALIAQEHMSAISEASITTSDIGAYDHGDCAGPAIFSGLIWMNQRLDICDPEGLDESTDNSWTIAPNPSIDGQVVLRGTTGKAWSVRDLSGRVVSKGVSTSSSEQVNIDAGVGVYFVEVEGLGIKKVVVVQ